jgi:hypothetical protein
MLGGWVIVRRTVPGLSGARLLFRWGHASMGHLPLQADYELKHHQRRDNPVCGSVMHDLSVLPSPR